MLQPGGSRPQCLPIIVQQSQFHQPGQWRQRHFCIGAEHLRKSCAIQPVGAQDGFQHKSPHRFCPVDQNTVIDEAKVIDFLLAVIVNNAQHTAP